jgi:hypothetical protein
MKVVLKLCYHISVLLYRKAWTHYEAMKYLNEMKGNYYMNFQSQEIRFDVPEVHLLGDARQVQNIMYAIWDAYEVARSL